MNSGLDLQTEPLTNYMSSRPGTGVFNRQENLISWYHEAPTGVYKVADAKVVIPTNEISNIAEALNSDALRAVQHLDRYDDRDVLAAAVAEAVRDWKYEDLSKAFDARGVWYGIVQDYEGVANDPQMVANNIFCQVNVNGETATLVNHPLRYNGKVPELHTLSTAVGSHTSEILREMGISDAEANRLFANNIVFGPTEALRHVAE